VEGTDVEELDAPVAASRPGFTTTSRRRRRTGPMRSGGFRRANSPTSADGASTVTTATDPTASASSR
jgi:hypothetical protein